MIFSRPIFNIFKTPVPLSRGAKRLGLRSWLAPDLQLIHQQTFWHANASA